MTIKLMGALDYAKLNQLLSEEGLDADKICEIVEQLEKEGRIRKVATAGRLSRNPGSVFSTLELTDSKTYQQNIKFAQNVIEMGHDSITDHDYLVFAIKDVSPVIEQTIIAERFSSFTIKSRREVDFSKVGYYIPNFRHSDGTILENNEEVQELYKKHMNSLFEEYSNLVDQGISKEDARFVLPYCYHSNIIMGIDAHTLKDMIIKYTKTHLSKIQELKEFGETLKAIAKENVPYIIPEIDKTPYNDVDKVHEYLERKMKIERYQVLDKPVLLNHSKQIDKTILVAAFMHRYQYDVETANKRYEKLVEEDPSFQEDLMKLIAFSSDASELKQVNFQFQVPLSFAVLTHLTRHRTHHLLVPEFNGNIDLAQYKVPPKIASTCLEEYENVFQNNIDVRDYLKERYDICDEDLIYFVLSGNLVNALTNIDGWTLKHILGLRECTKAQWETRAMAINMHKEIDKLEDATLYSKILGSTCMTQGFCKEGKESCGKLKVLEKKMNEKNAAIKD